MWSNTYLRGWMALAVAVCPVPSTTLDVRPGKSTLKQRTVRKILYQEKLLNLPHKKFTWVRLFWNLFRHDYSNLGRFTQLCQTFDLFVCLLIGFSFIFMNYNPLRNFILHLIRVQEGGFREIRQTCEAELCAGLPYITITCLTGIVWRIFYPFLRGFLLYTLRAYILVSQLLFVISCEFSCNFSPI